MGGRRGLRQYPLGPPFTSCPCGHPMYPGDLHCRWFLDRRRRLVGEVGFGSSSYDYTPVPARMPNECVMKPKPRGSVLTAMKSNKRMHQAAMKAVKPKVIKSTMYTMANRMLKSAMALKASRAAAASESEKVQRMRELFYAQQRLRR